MLCSEVRNAIRKQAIESGLSWKQITAAMRDMPPPEDLRVARKVETVEQTVVMRAVDAACVIAEKFRGQNWKTA